MIDRIEHDGRLYAIIIRSGTDVKATEFFTPKDNSLQMGIIKHGAGYKEPPHVHREHRKVIMDVQETLHIEKGRVKMNFYDDEGGVIDSTVLECGDVAALIEGGHAIEVLEDFTGIKVKQGPYVSIEEDKKFLGDADSSGKGEGK
jgi:hypothetical protein